MLTALADPEYFCSTLTMTIPLATGSKTLPKNKRVQKSGKNTNILVNIGHKFAKITTPKDVKSGIYIAFSLS